MCVLRVDLQRLVVVRHCGLEFPGIEMQVRAIEPWLWIFGVQRYGLIKIRKSSRAISRSFAGDTPIVERHRQEWVDPPGGQLAFVNHIREQGDRVSPNVPSLPCQRRQQQPVRNQPGPNGSLEVWLRLQ